MTVKRYISSIRLIYFAQMGSVVFASAVLLTIMNGEPLNAGLHETLQYACLAMAAILIPASILIYKSITSNTDRSISLSEKFKRFQMAVILRVAMLEIVGLFAVVSMFLTGDTNFLILAAIVLVMMFYFRPTVEELQEDMQLSENEKLVITSEDSEIQ